MSRNRRAKQGQTVLWLSRRVWGQTNIGENIADVLSTFGQLSITTGNDLMSQHEPSYVGMAFPFAMPVAVGGYDFHGKTRWGRPEDQYFFGREIFPAWYKVTNGKYVGDDDDIAFKRRNRVKQLGNYDEK